MNSPGVIRGRELIFRCWCRQGELFKGGGGIIQGNTVDCQADAWYFSMWSLPSFRAWSQTLLGGGWLIRHEPCMTSSHIYGDKLRECRKWWVWVCEVVTMEQIWIIKLLLSRFATHLVFPTNSNRIFMPQLHRKNVSLMLRKVNCVKVVWTASIP